METYVYFICRQFALELWYDLEDNFPEYMENINTHEIFTSYYLI